MERNERGKFIPNTDLTSTQIEAIVMNVYEKKTVVEMCKELGVARSTYYSWFKQQVFVEELDNERNRKFKALSGKALNKLEELMDSADSRTALKACEDVLKENNHLREQIDLTKHTRQIVVSLAEDV